jgi:hypothetical protein
MELLFQKGSTGLVCACEEATQWLSKKKLGATILVEPRERALCEQLAEYSKKRIVKW